MKVTRVGGRISRVRLPPGGQANHGWLAPRGATCPGGKINWDTGFLDGSRSSGLFRKGKTHVIAKFHRTNLP